ncbi:MAG: cysteine desulfurase family protein [Patescibacteria group bacterium]
MPKEKFVYLDNAATTQIDPRVFKAMEPYLKDDFGNASSLHLAGDSARRAVEVAQLAVADFLGAEATEICFTSGATESDNLALLGCARALQKKNFQNKIHIIVSRIEHDAILEPAAQLLREGVEVTYLKVNSKGLVDLAELKQQIKDNTVLISIMYANNEVGTVQPIKEIGREVAELNRSRKNKIYFHTDVTQAPAYLDCRADYLGADMMSLSGHKIYGPKGVGVLYIRKGTPLAPLIYGGHQQNNVRPGTYNVAAIVGVAKALEIIRRQKNKTEIQKIQKMRDYLISRVQKNINRVKLNGDGKKRLPNNANFIFEGIEGESLLLLLSQKKIAVSTGSACSSGSLEPSHVLTAMGVRPELAHGSLRVTLGRFSVKADVDVFLKELIPAVSKLRAMSPIKN